MKIPTKVLNNIMDKMAWPKLSNWMAPFGFLGLTWLMFGDVLMASHRIVLSKFGSTDLAYFLTARKFGFNQLRQGNLALWNPHLFSGTPFFGMVQPALFYPINWIHLFLPVGLAINMEIVIHFFIAGMATYLWCRYRGLTRPGSFLAGVLFIFSGSYFLRIYGGQLPILAGIAWAPILFLVVDSLFRSKAYHWPLLGMMVVAMQLLAGHPQFAYYTGIAATLYLGLGLIRTQKRWRPVLSFIAMYAGGVLLVAVQLLPAMQVASEGLRNKGMSYELSAISSFPPENLLTLFMPFVFGDMSKFLYFGRWHLWEVSFFFGGGGVALALYGIRYGEKTVRRFSGTMVFLLGVLALGAYTPVFKILHDYLPGYSLFRVHARFNFLVILFLSMLAGIGFDHLLKTNKWPRGFTIFMAVAGLLLAGFGALVYFSASSGSQGLWRLFLKKIDAGGGCFLPASYYRNPIFMEKAGLFASKQIAFAAGTLMLVALLFFLRRFHRQFAYGLLCLVVVEMFFWGNKAKATIDLKRQLPAGWRQVLEKRTGDFRILDRDLEHANLGMTMGVNNLWGYDPIVLKRYAEFISNTQGISLNKATHKLKFERIAKIFSMLRLKYVLRSNERSPIVSFPDPMPRLQLVKDYEVLSTPDDIFDELADPGFNPRKKVILEFPPNPVPGRSDGIGAASILRSSTDELEIKAELSEPAILVITDAYSQGWRAIPFEDSSQKKYQVMPANYVLRAVPLAAGKHHFLLEYAPLSFRVGKWISIVALALYVAAWIKSCFFKKILTAEDAKDAEGS